MKPFTLIALLALQLYITEAYGIYCGERNCYDVLEIARGVTRDEVTKAYRGLARKWHPDRFNQASAKRDAEEKFREIANAYEILRDDETRGEYDYYTDHPEEFYNYYAYYRRRASHFVDVRIVIFVVITLFTAFQYYGQYSNYEAAVDYYVKDERFRSRAREIATQEGLLPLNGAKRPRGTSKQELRDEENEILRNIIRQRLVIRGGYAAPSVHRLWIVKLLLLPVWPVTWLHFKFMWFWRFSIRKEPYTDTEKWYLIKRQLQRHCKWLSEDQIEDTPDAEKNRMMSRELWIRANFDAYMAEEEEKNRERNASNSKMRRYRRFLKNNPSRHANVFAEDE